MEAERKVVRHHMLMGDIASSLAGTTAVFLGKAAGMISIAGIGQAFILGMAGAAGGYLVKKFLDKLFKK